MASTNGTIPDSSIAELSVETETARYHHREPPPPYSPAEADTNQQPVIHQTIIIQAPLRNRPMLHECPICQQSVLTKVKTVNSRKTHMLAGCIFGCTCWCLLCCFAAIPYIIPTFKTTEHYCPICNNLLGSYNKV